MEEKKILLKSEKMEVDGEVYKKPVFTKEKEMVFPKEVIENFNGGRFCVQCSGCHGCR